MYTWEVQFEPFFIIMSEKNGPFELFLVEYEKYFKKWREFRRSANEKTCAFFISNSFPTNLNI